MSVLRASAPACNKPELWHNPRRQNQLYLFLPGTQSEPNKYDGVLSMAAYAGYKTIGLSYNNTTGLGDACAASCGCYGPARREVVFGGNPSPAVTVQSEDTIVYRLYRLLASLVKVATTNQTPASPVGPGGPPGPTVELAIDHGSATAADPDFPGGSASAGCPRYALNDTHSSPFWFGSQDVASARFSQHRSIAQCAVGRRETALERGVYGANCTR